MVEHKGSFILYTDCLACIEPLDMEARGRLFTAVLEYAKSGDTHALQPAEQVAYMFIKQQIDREASKYAETCRRRSEAGKMGGRPKKQEVSAESKKSNCFSEKAKESKKSHNEPDNDPVPEHEHDTISPLTPQGEPPAAGQIIQHLNAKTGAKFSPTAKATVRLINGRLSEGYTVQDFITVIDRKCADWLSDPKMCQYLRPDTLFSPSKFEGYLHGVQAPAPAQGEQKQEGRVLQRWD